MRRIVLLMALFGTLACTAWADQTPAETVCTFQDGKQISVRYSKMTISGKAKLSDGTLWTPGQKPMLLFSQTELLVNNTAIAPAAYSLYLIPGKDNWTLVVNKGDGDVGKYYEGDDLVRVSMPKGRISGPAQPFSAVFAHVAPKQCNLRIYDGKIGTWAEIKEK